MDKKNYSNFLPSNSFIMGDIGGGSGYEKGKRQIMQAARLENIRQNEVKTTCHERADGGVLILIRQSFSFFP